jgi:hypothetical protein
MNASFESQLCTAIGQAIGKGDKRPPEKLLQIVATLAKPLSDVFNDEIGHRLFWALREEFECLSQARDCGRTLTEAEHSELVGLIRWLLAELRKITTFDESGGRLLACLVTARFIGEGRTLWRNIFLPRNRYLNLFMALGRLLENSRCGFSSHVMAVPIYEQEIIDSFQHADQKEDFVGVEKCFISMRNILLPHFFLEEATLCLAFHDYSTLVAASSAISQTVAALWVIEPLPNSLRLCLAVDCKNNRIRFASLYKCLHDQRRKQRRLGRTINRLLAMLLVDIAKDSTTWLQFMTIFNKYPVRYPELQSALGMALSHVSIPAANAYVDAIDVEGASGREEVTECLRTFKSIASDKLRRIVFERCFQLWDEFLSLTPGESDTRLNLVFSKIDFGVVSFMMEFVDYSEIVAKVLSIEAELSALHLKWFASETALLSKYYTLLSRLQLYTHAKRIKEFGGDFSLAKGYLPPSAVHNRYFQALTGKEDDDLINGENS